MTKMGEKMFENILLIDKYAVLLHSFQCAPAHRAINFFSSFVFLESHRKM